jgi:hypothetical protein
MIARPVRCGLPAFALLLVLSACGGTTFDPGASQIEQPPQQSAAPPVATLGGQTYTVVAGDTIDSVARQYGVPVDVLIQANNLALSTPGRPAAGDTRLGQLCGPVR